MNKRIQEITGQVLDELVPETWTRLGYDKIKEIQFRTAELIVKECLDIAQDRAAFDGFPPNDVNHIIDEIREHFGVEE